MEISYQKQIHDYLEGALGEEEQQRLFDNLSANPEWREELAFQMRMQEAMQKDMASVTIPASATASVFSALNFGIPQKASAMIGIGFVRSGMTKIILAVASLGVIGVVWFVITNTSEKRISHTAVLQNNQTINPIDHISPVRPMPTIKNIPANSAANKSAKDIGKFSSIDYLTKSKIIGITTNGNIFLSNDGGSLWSSMRSNTSKDLYGVHFTDSSNGIIVGAGGTILLTATGGREWANIASGTEANLIAVRYITRDTLYACGAQGTILKSITGGLIWQKLESGTTESLFKISFQNGKIGTVSGERGIVLMTIDGGISWSVKK
jgi:hypothetical protein